MARHWSLVVLALCIFKLIIKETDCSSYHVAFLGRSPPVLTNVGSLLYPTINPNPVITSAVVSCTSSVTPVSLAATSFTEVLINAPTCDQLLPEGNEIKSSGIKVESSTDFILHVYQQNSDNNSRNEGYLAIPDEHLGNEYYVVTYCTLGGQCQFAVVGIIDNTQVNIIFPDNVTSSVVCVSDVPITSDTPPGIPVTFMINEFDVIHFESEYDLTGTYIFADNNVGVISGSRDIPTSLSGHTSSNLIEQLPPVAKWGYSFVASPNYFNDAGDVIKIIANKANTIVTISGFSPFKIPDQGGHIELRIDWQMHSHIDSSNQVMILQIMSIDLYNETSDVTGTPSLVLVPHIEQWTNSDMPFYCSASASNQTLITVVTDTDDSYSIPVLPTPTTFLSSWSVIDGTDYSVQIFEPVSSSTTVYGPPHSSYGYCDGSSTLLLNADWSWSKQACVQSVVSPGDNVDNDCDGQVDEDDCVAEDFETVFTSTRDDESGNVTYKTMSLEGTHFVYITILTCNVAMVTLENEDIPFHRMNIRISPTSIVAEMCHDYCLSAIVHTHIVTDCTLPQPYKIQWDNQLTVYAGTLTYTFYLVVPGSVDYDVLTLSAFTGSVEFHVALPEKDCKKVIRGADADTLGSHFIVPVHNTDVGFIAIISTRGDQTGTVTVQLDVSHSLGVIELAADKTILITETDITQSGYDKITVSATGGEISVYLIRGMIAGDMSKGPVLPTDILGTSYHVFKHTETTFETFCDVYTVDHVAQTNAGTVNLDSNKEIQQQEYDDLGTSRLLKSYRPLAVFCGTFHDTFLQIPPVETLGKQFFIPAIDLDSLSATAVIVVITSEDSTVVTIRGDYDRRDTVDLKGNITNRNLVSNTIFSITTTKPVQVHLQITSSSLSLTSDIHIPDVAQYKTSHVFPGITDFAAVQSSFAVDCNGNSVTSLISVGATFLNAQTVEYSVPTFSLTFMLFIASDIAFVIPSDVLFNDINKVCILTTGSPGDGIDNDCDGLIDEEQCSDSIVPGTIDYDIDGSLHEDCAIGTSTTAIVLDLLIPDAMVTCPQSNGTGSDVNNQTDGIFISGTETTDLLSSATTPEVIETNQTPNFEPFTIIGADIQIEGSSDLPEETCRTVCLCPCGWVSIQNYTQEELEESVAEIQEKLKVKKNELSAVIRTKTSATDDRPSATAVGVVGLVFLVVAIGSVALLDVATLISDVIGLAKTIKTFITS